MASSVNSQRRQRLYASSPGRGLLIRRTRHFPSGGRSHSQYSFLPTHKGMAQAYRKNVQCQNLQVFEVQPFSLDTGPQLFCHSLCCWKSAPKSAVWMCQIAACAGVMETTQMVVSQF